ncbi:MULTISPECIES: alpha/beta hydrolase [Rhodomicrobium]|uniref:alpha/beta hydrolase n=1 Tax=Rhodomicrobium TaxID=1068 RepID=UPI000B4B09C3|nr:MULTISPECIES: alpha/beta hydrolase [Rhodomicrobium]
MSGDLGFIHRFEPGDTGNTLLLLHGTGGDERDLIGLAQELAPGWALLSPRGKVLENGMPRFFRRLAEGVFDVADLKARAEELAQFIEAAIEHYRIDRTRLFALGYSNGANIAAGMMLLRPDAIAGAALLRPMVPFEPDAPVNLSGKPVLLLFGRLDPLMPPGQSARLEALFTERGAKVERHVLPASHGLTQGDVDLTRNWLETV